MSRIPPADPTAASRAERLRQRRRRAGLRLVQFWVPDVRQPAFAARIRRQCRTIAAAVTADEQAMLDAYEREAGVLPGWR